MIGRSILPVNTSPEVYDAVIAARSPVVRGAGVAPPSGDNWMLRADHGSNWAGSAQAAGVNGQPSWTMSRWAFQEPTFALRSRNSAGVIAPDRSAESPYWTPTLSHAERAYPSGPTP